MTNFAEVSDLVDRLDWELDEAEQRIAQAALDDLSDMARHYGREWNPETAPRMVRTTVLAAAVRYMRNPEGYTQSRAGDETVVWDDDAEVRSMGTAKFSGSEIALLRELGGKARSSLTSAPLVAWGTGRNPRHIPGLVPVRGDGDPFPLYRSDTSPW